jgi:hypothetical protein
VHPAAGNVDCREDFRKSQISLQTYGFSVSFGGVASRGSGGLLPTDALDKPAAVILSIWPMPLRGPAGILDADQPKLNKLRMEVLLVSRS